MSKANSVVDINGARYELTELVGRGGQGAVYSIKGGRLAAKVIPGSDPVRRERLRNQLAFVRRLPLHDLNLAKPLEMLREPNTGYVMELLTDMVPIQSLLAPPKNASSIPEWFQQTGGLRRRLIILGKVAAIMARLHGKGLAYSDPSPANIFISKDSGYEEVWFIDTDNLCYESNIQAGGAVFTPRYGAPELVRGEAGVSTLTDVHAFAVIAFQVLTLVHPFVGDYVNDGEPELEEQALAGHVPWVEDKDDDINYAGFGIPRNWVLSKKLWDMFAKTFGEGRVDPKARPGAAEWAERLSNAADATIICPECGGTYYFSSNMCTWCDAGRPAVLKARLCLWEALSGNKGQIVTKPQNGKKKPVFVDQLTMSEGETAHITRRLAFNDQGKSAYEPVVALEFQANRLHMSSLNGQEYRLLSVHDKNETTITASQKTISGQSGTLPWLLHLGPLDKSHRILIFQIEPRDL